MSVETSSATGETAKGAPNIYPCLGYRDARAAIAWLCEAFGFEERMVHAGEDRDVAHAELNLGPGIVMLGSQQEGMPSAGELTPRPTGDELNFAQLPFSIYVAIEDIDAHCARARSAGAEIVREPFDTDYGSRDYAARDLEGNVWSFGTYRPVGG
ncbi:MAG: VOC family protein [Thermoleophilaceae bacterium]